MKLPVFALFLAATLSLHAEEIALFGPDVHGSDALVFPNGGKQPDVSFAADPDGVAVTVEAPGVSSFPGVFIKPPSPWDVSGHGRIEATVTNTSAQPIRVFLRVDDDAGDTGTNSVGIPPGEKRAVAVYLDYAGKAKLKASAIKSVLVFASKSPNAQTFRIDRVVATGPAGEKPPTDPKTVAIKPPGGVLLNTDTAPDVSKQLTSHGAAKGSAGTDGLQLTFTGAEKEGVTFKPAEGFWNLNEYIQVRVQVKNIGSAPVTPRVRLESKDGPTEEISAVAPIAPGATAEIVVPFAPSIPWEGPDDPDVSVPDIKKNFKGQPGTGTRFVSHRVNGVTVLGGPSAGQFLVSSIRAENSTPELPDWLGQRPPVEGEWTKTFEDNFDGSSVDLTKWNIYGPNFWDKRTHFSKDNAIVKDGALTLRVERKTGRHNDSPDGKETDYATGFADTYGKWVQRYGYFEARVKLPTAPCLWPAFWLMPDRGLEAGEQWKRQATQPGGMEFDIIEQLSIWGPQRLNMAMHWDGYGKGHKATGSGSIYVPADKDGFIVVGLLWTPESAVLYGNGKELARWKNPRISDVPSCILLDHVTGGWETEALDDAQLPADFVIDYVRVWQRADLASEVDGPKPNQGTPAAPKE